MSRRQKATNRKRAQRQSGYLPALAIGGVATAIGFAMQFTPASRDFRQMKSEVNELNNQQVFQAKVLAAQSKTNVQALEAELEARKLEATIAHTRYYSGCIVSFLPPEPGEQYATKVAAITEGFKPIDVNTNLAFPTGKEVCDDRGTTAEIGRDGYVDMDTVANATDMDVVNGRFASAAHWHPRAHRSEIEVNSD